MEPVWLDVEKLNKKITDFELSKGEKAFLLVIVSKREVAKSFLGLLEKANKQIDNDRFSLNFKGKSDVGLLPVFCIELKEMNYSEDTLKIIGNTNQIKYFGGNILNIENLLISETDRVSGFLYQIYSEIKNQENKKFMGETPDFQSSREDKLH